jgi:hypothetical protein
MKEPLTIHPTNSEPFEIGDKVTTIILEGNQLVIGDPCYGVGDRYAEYPFDPSTRSTPFARLLWEKGSAYV